MLRARATLLRKLGQLCCTRFHSVYACRPKYFFRSVFHIEWDKVICETQCVTFWICSRTMGHTGGCTAERTGERTMGRFAWARSREAALRLSRFCGFQQPASSSGSSGARSGPAPVNSAVPPFSFEYFSVPVTEIVFATLQVSSAASAVPSKILHQAPAEAAGRGNWREWEVAMPMIAQKVNNIKSFLERRFLHRFPKSVCFFFCGGPTNFTAFAFPALLICAHPVYSKRMRRVFMVK